MGDDRLDVETSVEGLIEQLDDSAIDRLIDRLGDDIEGLVMVVRMTDGDTYVEALTTKEDGKPALALAASMYGGLAIEAYMRFVTCITALREVYGEEVETHVEDTAAGAPD